MVRGNGTLMRTPRVTVGIINYGDYRHLPVCLDSVKRQSLTADRIILVDNQSSVSEIAPIASAYPEVRLLSMREYLGYSGGANRIIPEADRCDYVLLLNPDAVLD